VARSIKITDPLMVSASATAPTVKASGGAELFALAPEDRVRVTKGRGKGLLQ